MSAPATPEPLGPDVDPDVAGARPAGDGGKAVFGQVPREPAIEADAVVVRGNGVLPDLSLRGALFVVGHGSEYSCQGEAADQREDRRDDRGLYVNQRDPHAAVLHQQPRFEAEGGKRGEAAGQADA